MIRFRDVSVRYRQQDGQSREVLQNINLTIEHGEFIAIMGRNGSGKTTLARLCNGLVLPSAGTVDVDSLTIAPDDHHHIPAIRRCVGMVFQNPENQIISTTVEREIAFGLENLGKSLEDMHERVNEVLLEFDLQSYRNRPPYMLSGGEKQRLALASVMAMQPAYLVLDEPTAMLDFMHKKRFLSMIEKLASNKGHEKACTILFITQDPVEALFAQRLIVLHEKKAYLDGPPRDIFLEKKALKAPGLFPPLEFAVFHVLEKNDFEVSSIDDILLSPILR